MARKNIIILGGKTQTKSLAQSLLLRKYNVTVVSPDESFCNRLSEISGLNVIFGEGTNTAVLEDADINQYDIAIAMNDHDADNLIALELCKKIYGVKKTISLASDTKRKPLFDAMGVDSVICATGMVAATIEQETVADEISRVVPTTDGRVRISEVVAVKEAPIVGKTLAAIQLPKQTIIGCIIRSDEIIIPNGSTVINTGDNLLVITTAEQEAAALEVITGR